MKFVVLNFTILLAILSAILCDKISMSLDGVLVEASETPGKIFMGTEDREKAMAIFLNNLVEVDSEGKEILLDDVASHKLGFNDKLFTFSNFTEGKYRNLSVYQGSMQFDDYRNPNSFKVNLYYFNEEGVIDYYWEQYKVRPKALLFEVEIDGWKYCDKNSTQGITYCKDGNTTYSGSYLDLNLEVKSYEVASNTEKNVFNLGNYQLVFSKYSIEDSAEATLNSLIPENFPALKTKDDDTHSFKIRFPAFGKKIRYRFMVYLNNSDFTFWLVLGISIGVVSLAIVAFVLFRCIKRRANSEALMQGRNPSNI
jgi:hypothetical protein